VADCDDGELQADEGLLRQLLLNLVSNAARVTPAGGLVTLSAKVRASGRWRVVVTDEGPGLPPEQLERIFGRFVRLVPAGNERVGGASGHGLGLAICRSIAALHGGSIHAENRADGRTGLRVVVELAG
jgi:signal transduction histidine kinase